ncbi:uncharacterized protein LOC129927440 isoform X2 [Biomphalaria glabrata]|uniref:Uncharacterized protein LOC129927440 isoform X2 n=1 Tax=Biomphalaria glabrata TaxID=6526 RepID=A0A9W3AZP4_BIOGL|nr:uncharacterized protein LOC129927440 isoform X2 [Biomphalaria glabrata]
MSWFEGKLSRFMMELFFVVFYNHLTYISVISALPSITSSSLLLDWNTVSNVTSMSHSLSHRDQNFSSRPHSTRQLNFTAMLTTPNETSVSSHETLDNSIEYFSQQVNPNSLTKTHNTNEPEPGSAIGSLLSNKIEIMNSLSNTSQGDNIHTGVTMSTDLKLMEVSVSSNKNLVDVSMSQDDLNVREEPELSEINLREVLMPQQGINQQRDLTTHNTVNKENNNVSSFTKWPQTNQESQTESQKMNAEEIYNSTKNSLNTLKTVPSASDGIHKENATLQNERHIFEQNIDFQTAVKLHTTPQTAVKLQSTPQTTVKLHSTPNSKANKANRPENTFTRLKPYANAKGLEKTQVATLNDVDNNWNSTQLTITLQSYKDSVTAYWTYESNNTQVTGFLVTYRINKREHFDSSKLGKYVRAFTLHSLHEDEDYVICVHAMVNATAVKEACAHWNENSMKILVGIMAGILFLVPCIVVVILILVKDRQVRKKCGQLNKQTTQEQKLIGFQMKHHDGQVKSTNEHACVCVMKSCPEGHIDSEDELWKQQT